MILLMILQIGFSLAICQALQLFIADESASLADRLEMRQYYGNFPKTLYTMFEITFSGSWPGRVRPVTSKVSGWYAIPFLFYIALVVFAVIKIVTALFLKETLSSAANDADMMLEDSERISRSYQSKIEGLFRLADDDGDGLLTLEEFMETMSLQSVKHYLKILDVTVHDSRILFDSLDDGDGLVTIAEFCQGISKLKGHVKPVDFITLQRENSRILKECRSTSKEVRKTSNMLQKVFSHRGLEATSSSNSLGLRGTETSVFETWFFECCGIVCFTCFTASSKQVIHREKAGREENWFCMSLHLLSTSTQFQISSLASWRVFPHSFQFFFSLSFL